MGGTTHGEGYTTLSHPVRSAELLAPLQHISLSIGHWWNLHFLWNFLFSLGFFLRFRTCCSAVLLVFGKLTTVFVFEQVDVVMSISMVDWTGHQVDELFVFLWHFQLILVEMFGEIGILLLHEQFLLFSLKSNGLWLRAGHFPLNLSVLSEWSINSPAEKNFFAAYGPWFWLWITFHGSNASCTLLQKRSHASVYGNFTSCKYGHLSMSICSWTGFLFFARIPIWHFVICKSSDHQVPKKATLHLFSWAYCSQPKLISFSQIIEVPRHRIGAKRCLAVRVHKCLCFRNFAAFLGFNVDWKDGKNTYL